MNTLNTILKDLGLTDTETQLYITGLSYPDVSVSELEKQTGIKRTTIYHALNTLGAKGFVSSSSAGGATLHYTMTPPSKLERVIDKKREQLEVQRTALTEIIPLLEQRTQTKEVAVKVSHFSGMDGIKNVIDEALYCKSKKWRIIAPNENFFTHVDRDFTRYFMATRARRGITTRALWERSDNWKQLTPEEKKTREPRMLPKSMTGHFQSLIIIFDTKVTYISSHAVSSAILIDAEEVFDTMAGLFDALWTVSEEYSNVK